METKEMTVNEWLQDLTDRNTSSEYDEMMMQKLTRKCGFADCVVTCGIVYLEGKGHPLSIHTVAREILARQ